MPCLPRSQHDMAFPLPRSFMVRGIFYSLFFFLSSSEISLTVLQSSSTFEDICTMQSTKIIEITPKSNSTIILLSPMLSPPFNSLSNLTDFILFSGQFHQSGKQYPRGRAVNFSSMSRGTGYSKVFEKCFQFIIFNIIF